MRPSGDLGIVLCFTQNTKDILLDTTIDKHREVLKQQTASNTSDLC